MTFLHFPSRRRLGSATIAIVLSALLLLGAVACGGDSVSQAERVVAPTSVPAPSGVGADGQELTLEVVVGGATTGLVLTDHRGFVVYGVTGEAAEGEPTCFGDCLDVWIPLSPRDLAVSDQLEIDLFAVYTRPDGIDQVVYAGIPLYLWTGDREVGITGGAGVAGTWFALTETAGFIG